jgi:hypothetical protein
MHFFLSLSILEGNYLTCPPFSLSHRGISSPGRFSTQHSASDNESRLVRQKNAEEENCRSLAVRVQLFS